MDNGKELGHARVFRYDPETDKAPRYEDYLAPIEGQTVLDVLRYIYENCDATLSFRFGCDGAGYIRCGACAVLVNGTPAFSCKKLAEEGMLIEPHPKFEVVKDLVTDFDKYRDGNVWTVASVTITVDSDECDGCRDCVLLCPLGVYEIQKKEGKGRAVPVDVGSCCGLTCNQCAIYCRRSAIKVEAVAGVTSC
jgi:NAD-dependent dihydropyrimidine dehydrogenase PreA subunit